MRPEHPRSLSAEEGTSTRRQRRRRVAARSGSSAGVSQLAKTARALIAVNRLSRFVCDHCANCSSPSLARSWVGSELRLSIRPRAAAGSPVDERAGATVSLDVRRHRWTASAWSPCPRPPVRPPASPSPALPPLGARRGARTSTRPRGSPAARRGRARPLARARRSLDSPVARGRQGRLDQPRRARPRRLCPGGDLCPGGLGRAPR